MKFLAFLGVMVLSGCASSPDVTHKVHDFPEDKAYVGEPKPMRKYEKLGVVKERIDFPSLDSSWEFQALCKNYFNHAVKKLIDRAEDIGADAVIRVQSVVFLMNGGVETFPRAECSDEGSEGQVLVEGLAVKWVKEEDEKSEGKAAPLN